MASSFTLTLDTLAPVVDFGDPLGATAGELLRVPYTSDEPLDAAELRLSDGRHLALTIAIDELSVLLPADTPAGAAAIWVRDEVWNAHTYTAAVILQGVVVPVDETPRTPGVPRGPAPRAQATRRIRTRSRVEVRSRTSIRARGRYLSVATARTRNFGGGQLRTRDRIEARSHSRVAARAAMPATAVTAVTTTRIRRGDGPSLEEAFLLDLL